MTEEQLRSEASKFRQAIEKARDAGEFRPNNFKFEGMNRFPIDCCDDTADLFTHYLFHQFNVDSLRIVGGYYDTVYKQCYHSWQETEGWIVDLTGDQFENNVSVPIKANAVYVGKMDDFHQQFKIVGSVQSCGIECLGYDSWDRMYGLYYKIMKYMK